MFFIITDAQGDRLCVVAGLITGKGCSEHPSAFGEGQDFLTVIHHRSHRTKARNHCLVLAELGGFNAPGPVLDLRHEGTSISNR